MKTNKHFQFALILVAVLGLALTGCKKEKNDSNPDSTSLQQLSKDEINVVAASDEALNDVSMMLSGGQLKSTQLWPCHATIDSTSVINDTITYYITYDGLNCPETIYRSGQVEVKKQVGTHWGQPGATVTVKLIDFERTRVATGRTVILNGTKIFKNVSGGHIWQLGYGVTTIEHRITGSVQATFEDNTTRTWNIARKRVFTGTPENLVMTVDGFGSEGEYNNLVLWGINRQGENFYIQINQSVVHKQICEWNPVSGVKIISIPGDEKKATITYGYDDNNQPVTGNECPTRYKVDWEKHNHSGTIFLPL